MSHQAQCPNCGGYKLESSLAKIDPKTENKVDSGVGTFILATIALTFIYAVSNNNPESISSLGLIAILVYVVVMIVTFVQKNRATKRAYNLYKFYCNLCGYRWQWREGTSLPKVKANPGLIAKGAQKQQEEEDDDDDDDKI